MIQDKGKAACQLVPENAAISPCTFYGNLSFHNLLLLLRHNLILDLVVGRLRDDLLLHEGALSWRLRPCPKRLNCLQIAGRVHWGTSQDGLAKLDRGSILVALNVV